MIATSLTSIVIQIVWNYSPAPLEPALPLVLHAHDEVVCRLHECIIVATAARRGAYRVFLVANKFIANINLPRFTDRLVRRGVKMLVRDICFVVQK